MKKCSIFILLVILSVLFLGCSSDKASESNLTLDDFIKAYTEQGIEVNKEKKPVFSLIKASDGVIFYVDNKKAAIYEYPSEKDMNEVIKDQKLMEQWTKKGKFILESKSEKAINIFNQVK